MSWPLIMLNMQSPAWHFTFVRNLVVFSLKPTGGMISGHRTLWCIMVLEFHLCSDNWMCEVRALVSHTTAIRGIELILATKREPIKRPEISTPNVNNAHNTGGGMFIQYSNDTFISFLQ